MFGFPHLSAAKSLRTKTRETKDADGAEAPLRKEGSGSHAAAPQNHLEHWGEHRAQSPPLGFLIQQVWGRAQESAFLTGSQGMLLSLGWGPHDKGHWNG